MINTNDLCMGCFEDIGGAEECPHCGYKKGTAQQSPACLPAGTVLDGRYLLGKTLGQGGFGITYLGYDLISGKKIAIKEYMPDGMATRQAGNTQITVYSRSGEEDYSYGMNKFLDEAKILAQFPDNPDIVKVYSFFLENGTAYFAMEYIDGMTLKEYMKSKGGRLDYSETLKILTPVMSALQAAHEKNLLHRDVSPDNVYIAKDGAVKLLDFGAARFNMGEHSKSLSVILKPGFAPEEQYRSRGNQGAWTDIYALSATFYYCLTGTVPPASLDRMQNDEIVPVFKAGTDLPEGAAAVIMKGLAVKSDYRWQSIADFKKALYNPAEYEAQNKQRLQQQTAQSYNPAPAQPSPQSGQNAGPNVTQNQPQNYQAQQPQTAYQIPYQYQPNMQAAKPKKSKAPVIACAVGIPLAVIIITVVIIASISSSHSTYTWNNSSSSEVSSSSSSSHSSVTSSSNSSTSSIHSSSSRSGSSSGKSNDLGGFDFGTIKSQKFENEWSDIKLDLPKSWRYLNVSEMKKKFGGSSEIFSDSTYTGGAKQIYDFSAVNSSETANITLFYRNAKESGLEWLTAKDLLTSVFETGTFKSNGTQSERKIGGYKYWFQEGTYKKDDNICIGYLMRKQGDYFVIIMICANESSADDTVDVVNSIKSVN